MKVSKSSWHYRYLYWVFDSDPTIDYWGNSFEHRPKSTAKYMIELAFMILVSPLLGLARSSKSLGTMGA